MYAGIGSKTWAYVAVGLGAAALALAIAAAVTGESLANALDDLVVAVLAAAAAAGIAAWYAARRGAAAAESRRRELEALLERREDELRTREGELWQAREQAAEEARLADERAASLERRSQELEAEHEQLERVRHWRDVEHEWNKELRRQIAELHEQIGTLGDVGDERELILRVAISLVGAEKGLLLSREDLDSDGDLDFAGAHGFEHDPEHSAVAQHFARRVIDQDETVRADGLEQLPLQNRNEADDEIENLIAIPIYIRDRFAGVVVCANKEGGFHEYDDDVLLSLGAHAGAALTNSRLRGDLRGAYLSTVRVLAAAIEAKDKLLRGHANEVSQYVANVAGQLGLDPRKREELIFASLLHDIGKIGISDRILLKPGALTDEERSIVELHPRIGFRMIDQVPALRGIGSAVLHHHERWDGEGYPGRLKGEAIPVEARLIGIADAFSAMTADRPYRKGMSVDDACEELKRCAGTQFDPTIVRHFIEEIRRRTRNGDGVGDPDLLREALDDPELEARRAPGEPILGFGAMSAIDNLTLLYSHRYLHEVAHAEAQRAEVQDRPFAAIFVEVTGLAELNRERGYDAGDDAIRGVGAAVQRVAARCGGTAGRESGSRIGLIVPGADERIAEQLADEISSELEDGHNVRMSVAVWQKGESGEDVLARARAREGKPAVQHA